MTDPHHWRSPQGRSLAFRKSEGCGPGLLWLGGFRSDMDGGKATALHAWAAKHGHAALRFDYSGHGVSEGRFEDFCIGDGIEDARAVLEGLTHGPQILVGSSMGGWIALGLALARPDRVAGLLLIAPAPDFTGWIEDSLSDDARADLARDGVWLMPTGDPVFGPTPITRKLLRDGPRHFMRGRLGDVRIPVRIVQGMRDTDVPWQGTVQLVQELGAEDAALTLVKDGDHRLSRPQDVARILAAAAELCASTSDVPSPLRGEG